MKLLAVDDDPVSLRLLEALLQQCGYSTLTATSLADAWSACTDGSVRVIVSDWKLADDDGLDLCRRIRQRGGDYVYFILLTQNAASNQNMDAAWAAGVDDFLTKPANQRDLRMRLHVAMRIVEYAKQVKQLNACIPICSYCKKIRDDRDYWEHVERYIQTHTGTQFSHGVCPTCYETRVIPEMTRLGIDPDSTD